MGSWIAEAIISNIPMSLRTSLSFMTGSSYSSVGSHAFETEHFAVWTPGSPETVIRVGTPGYSVLSGRTPLTGGASERSIPATISNS